jgi:hypothetical protein
MPKQIQTFLTSVDEMEFTRLLRKLRPNLTFIDGGRREKPTPPVQDSIQDCTNHFVFYGIEKLSLSFHVLHATMENMMVHAMVL